MTTIYKSKRIELCTYSKDSCSIVLDSGNAEYPGCKLRFTGFGYWLVIRIPAIVKPYMWKVKATYWDEATIARFGRDWYWQCDEREFGIGIHCGNHFNIYYGRQSDDSRLDKRWSCFLPWTEFKRIRWSGYGLNGEWVLDFAKDVREWSVQRDSLPKQRFQFADYDGELIVASCHIEEHEWSKGVGYFSWLRYLIRNRVHRDMSISFSAEVGRRKGSWKGGTVGHSIDLLPGELHEAAFIRYCAQQKLKYLGPAENEQRAA